MTAATDGDVGVEVEREICRRRRITRTRAHSKAGGGRTRGPGGEANEGTNGLHTGQGGRAAFRSGFS